MDAAINVGEVYAQLAHDLREGTRETASFAHAARMLRLIDAVGTAARTGTRQRVTDAAVRWIEAAGGRVAMPPLALGAYRRHRALRGDGARSARRGVRPARTRFPRQQRRHARLRTVHEDHGGAARRVGAGPRQGTVLPDAGVAALDGRRRCHLTQGQVMDLAAYRPLG